MLMCLEVSTLVRRRTPCLVEQQFAGVHVWKSEDAAAQMLH